MYYSGLEETTSANEMLDPRRIRDWVFGRVPSRRSEPDRRTYVLRVDLAREMAAYRERRLYVAPVQRDQQLVWIDAAGYTLATSAPPKDWPADPAAFDFALFVDDAEVQGQTYLKHR